MKLSDFVAQYLKKAGIRHIFGYQGGSITHLIESFDNAGIEYIQNYNEQGSAISADAYSRISNNGIGVAIASNGPGATNLITGIANAYCDSVATLFITGQVHTWGMKKSDTVRQESFQEIDIISMVKPITKYAVTIKNKNEILYELEKAIFLAKDGRQGPVLIDIPVDIQGMQIEEKELKGYFDKEIQKNIVYGTEDIQKFIDIVRLKLENCKRPILLVGGGVRDINTKRKIRQLAKGHFIPVVCSLQGLDVLNHDNPAFIGFIGSYGNRYANIALQKSDLIIVLGSRLDLRQTGKNKAAFAKNAYVIHVDIDESELNHNIKEDLSIQMDISKFVDDILSNEIILKNWKQWLNTLVEWKNLFKESEEPNIMLEKLNIIFNDKSIIVSDVGQNQMWVAQSLRIKGNDIRMLNSGGLGAMGYAIPGAIGAYYASQENETIVAFTGDGGIQMNIQELCLIGGRQLPVKIFLFNNKSLGLIREMHEKYYNNNCIGSVIGFNQPNFEILAKAYDIKYIRIDKDVSWQLVSENIKTEKPCLFDICLEGETYVRPELLGMDEIDNQSPYLSEEERDNINHKVKDKNLF